MRDKLGVLETHFFSPPVSSGPNQSGESSQAIPGVLRVLLSVVPDPGDPLYVSCYADKLDIPSLLLV